MDGQYASLRRILAEVGDCLVAFSGGVDSTFLLKVAHDVLGDRVTAVTAVSPSLPRAEREEAEALARLIGAPHLLVESHEIDDPRYVRNDAERCYFCKAELFRVLRSIGREAGGRTLLYGAIPDDLGDERPGMRAAAEAGARAPLLEAGLTKEMIRLLSRRLGLPTWDKPAMACLSSRIPRFTPVTPASLGLVERAEAAARALGYRLVRVRLQGGDARVELDASGLARCSEPEARARLLEAVRASGFDAVSIDPLGYRPKGRAPALSPQGAL
ncbi:MAG TPA: ATP-dependent sacrificial sulfur transferase LarE [Candidatus Polarisedimenticolia bacterium]|nr:ATP-dependent sacrificial sulfur transferase LarE [Candidatus Polarisedimenticolia bacterium]